MQLRGINGIEIELRPVAYEFPDLDTGEWHDLNWLTVAGEVSTPDGSWSFLDPCLLTTDADRLARWLIQVADGDVAPSDPDAEGDVDPDLGFVEPNIAFGIETRGGGDVILRVHFSLESAPPWSGDEQRVVSHQFFVRCWLSDEALRDAAAVWRDEVSHFPERGERSW